MPEENELLTADCYSMSVVPGMSRLFLDYCANKTEARAFYRSIEPDSAQAARPPVPAHWPDLVRLLAEQNSAPSPSAADALAALAQGARTIVTGQQVGLFGGPLFTPFKAATAVAHARQATAAGNPHAAIFWLATEDHDFAEIDHVSFPAGRELRKLVYSPAAGDVAESSLPVGGIVLDKSITPLVDQARQLLGESAATEALVEAYRPGRTFAQAFRDFYTKVFAAQGLLILDASGREFHRMGSPVLRAALERADELHAALMERDSKLEAAGYHAQVGVTQQSSLLFLIDENSGARLALKRTDPSAAEPDGIWRTNGQKFSTADLVGILDSEPERISPSALLRPVFQDFLLSTSVQVAGPAEVAYLAQSAVLFERILGEPTPIVPRFSATLVEPSISELLRKHELPVERVFGETPASLAQLLAARAMPMEGKQKLASAETALEAELTALLDWMSAMDEGLGKSAETAAGKIRYQMSRLRTLAANFELQRQSTLSRHAGTIFQALYPDGGLQERLHGAAYYFAHYGFELSEELTAQAAAPCPGHTVVWL